jgi:hypothetical protein
LRLSASKARFHALGNPRPFELGDCAKNMQLKFPCRRGGVDTFSEADEGDPESIEFVEEQNEMAEIAPDLRRRGCNSLRKVTLDGPLALALSCALCPSAAARRSGRS